MTDTAYVKTGELRKGDHLILGSGQHLTVARVVTVRDRRKVFISLPDGGTKLSFQARFDALTKVAFPRHS